MKKLVFLLAGVFCLSVNAQDKMTFESAVYINGISVSQIPRFVELHKKFTDMSMGENRKITGDWLFRHWYGSGHTFVMYQQFETMEDYHADGEIALANIEKHVKSIKDEKEREALMKDWREYRSFADGHTDEIRGAYESTGFLTVENVNFDIPFVMVVGRYNSSGNWAKMGNAYVDWQIKPGIANGNVFAGGVSYHYMGSGPEVEVWQCFSSLTDFAKAVSTPQNTAETSDSRKAFWELVDGDHSDQIYLHIGHVDLEKGIFDFAGSDK